MTTPDRPTAFHPLSWAYHALTSAREMSRNQPARWDQPTRWELGTQLRDALAAANPSDGTPPSTSGTLLGVRFVVSEVLSGYGWRILDTFGVAIVEGVARAADVPAGPRRGDVTESWIKRERDYSARPSERWRALDDLLDDYRLHADTGTPLTEVVAEGGYGELNELDGPEHPARLQCLTLPNEVPTTLALDVVPIMLKLDLRAELSEEGPT